MCSASSAAERKSIRFWRAEASMRAFMAGTSAADARRTSPAGRAALTAGGVWWRASVWAMSSSCGRQNDTVCRELERSQGPDLGRMSRRVLLLTSDTGGGHRSVAAALRLAAAERQEWQGGVVEIGPLPPP